MIRPHRIPTRRTLLERAINYAETSWVPLAMIYACIAAAVVAANWSKF